MQQLPCYGDQRNKGFCVHCGGIDETCDHVPSKVFLDDPYPDNLMVCAACLKCNNGLSFDEEYLACLLECIIAGDANPGEMRRPKIARTLIQKPALLRRLQDSKTQYNGQPHWSVEYDRVKAVVLKLARCHMAFELNEPQIGEPSCITFRPLAAMEALERLSFENDNMALLPEVGSRAMQRLLVVGSDVFSAGWLIVQDDNYRYRVDTGDGYRVRIVIREYLACEITWE